MHKVDPKLWILQLYTTSHSTSIFSLTQGYSIQESVWGWDTANIYDHNKQNCSQYKITWSILPPVHLTHHVTHLKPYLHVAILCLVPDLVGIKPLLHIKETVVHFSKHRPSGPMLSISQNVRMSVCPSVHFWGTV